jgi:hypothetical protein
MIKKAVLVYQGGLANVFEVKSFNLSDFGRNARRLIQSDFSTCEAFAKGLCVAGVTVRVAGCNQPGDIVNAKWTQDMDSLPFRDNQLYPREWLK